MDRLRCNYPEGRHTIGNGAIVGAGAVVIGNVPDYTIVAGNPAILLKQRFDGRIIQLLSELRWWDLTVEQLKEIESLFSINLVQDSEKAITAIKSCMSIKARITSQSID